MTVARNAPEADAAEVAFDKGYRDFKAAARSAPKDLGRDYCDPPGDQKDAYFAGWEKASQEAIKRLGWGERLSAVGVELTLGIIFMALGLGMVYFTQGTVGKAVFFLGLVGMVKGTVRQFRRKHTYQ
jgi:hypothetical protein